MRQMTPNSEVSAPLIGLGAVNADDVPSHRLSHVGTEAQQEQAGIGGFSQERAHFETASTQNGPGGAKGQRQQVKVVMPTTVNKIHFTPLHTGAMFGCWTIAAGVLGIAINSQIALQMYLALPWYF